MAFGTMPDPQESIVLFENVNQTSDHVFHPYFDPVFSAVLCFGKGLEMNYKNRSFRSLGSHSLN